jgi:hypothetical protein
MVGDRARWTEPWRNWLSQVRLICFAQQEFGTTANRPVENLYAGRRYWDSTLQKPIFYTGSGWKDAAGGAV